ncbi:MAG: hypothetical protein QW794_02205 [Thermosphaera sp.]
MSRMDWNSIVTIAESEARQYVQRFGIAPTLRGLFYILVSRGYIPNTMTAYRKLSSKVAEARYFGTFSWSLIRDESRVFWWGEVGARLADAEKVPQLLSSLSEEQKRELLKEYLSRRYAVHINRWEGQPYSVLVVVEKEAQVDAVYKMLNVDLSLDVSVTTSRGFESATAIRSIADWVQRVKDASRTPVLLLVFDWDPSGEYAGLYDLIFRILVLLSEPRERAILFSHWKDLRTFDEKAAMVAKLAAEKGVIYEKVMLTWEQVQRYNLPPEPQEEEARRKLQRDPRARMFIEKYGFLGQVEIDAMIALQYEEARRILAEAVRRYFDDNIYQEVRRREEELRRKVEEALSSL